MFSATMPLKVELLAKKYLRHPVFIAIGDRKGRAAKSVEQRIEWMSSDNQKRERLTQIVSDDEPPFIVFCNEKKKCDMLGRYLEGLGWATAVIHGGKIQEQRESSLEAFKANQADILVATDVVGRGIDVTGVQQVINYDMPSDIDRYTHRIGRTGRAGKSGIATSFLTDQDTEIMFDLKELLRETSQTIPFQLANHEAAKAKPGSALWGQAKNKVIFAKGSGRDR